MKKILLTLTALASVALTSSLTAQIPRTLTVQGVLADSLNRVVVDGIHTISVRIYDKQSGGNPLYFEEFTTPIFKGLFNLTLGSTKILPTSVGFDKPYFVGISYDGKQEMLRIPLSSVPYALIAETVPDGAITGSKIADGAITSDKLSPSLVLSLKAGDKTLGNTFAPPAFVGGGNNNTASGQYATIGAGLQNTASGWYSSIIGGNANTSLGNYSTIGGGQTNSSSGVMSSVTGGNLNSAGAQYSAIGGGYSNFINTNSTAGNIAGGYDNSIASGSQYASIGGGNLNTASAQYAHVGGGRVNTAAGLYSSVVGGWSNSVSSAGLYSFIGGGNNNSISGEYSSIPSGKNNTVSGNNSFINGGFSNSVAGNTAAVVGGANNSVGADGGIVIGNNLSISNSATNAIVIGSGPSAGSKLTSSTPNSLTIGFNSNIPTLFVDKAVGVGGYGKVGFGNSNPLTMIDMTGAFTMRSTGQNQPPVAPMNQGRIYFDEISGKFKASQNGSPYVDLIFDGEVGGGGGGWLLNGNNGIIEGVNFIGPTNDVYLDLRAGSDGQGGEGGKSSITRLRLNINGSIQRNNSGDDRGDESIDLQTFRLSGDQVASGHYSVLTGGQLNSVPGLSSVLSGGQENIADGIATFIGGGTNNEANGALNSIVGGGGNFISFDAQISSILGGGSNEINGSESGLTGGAIVGGDYNSVYSDYGFIGGGTENEVNGTGAVIGGGGTFEDDEEGGGFNSFGNTANGDFSGILGGADNRTENQYSTIGGGRSNSAEGNFSVIGGGLTNTTNGLTSTVSGGVNNTAEGDNSTVSGGQENNARGEFSTIPGGRMMNLTSNAARSFGFNGNSPNAIRDIVIDASNTAVWNNVDFWLTNNDGAPRSLRFYGLYDATGAFPNGTHFVGFKAPDAIASDVTWTLPDADGNDGQFLKTNGGGVLSWADGGGEGGGGLIHFTESENLSGPNSEGVPVVQLIAASEASNVDVALTPKGSGALLAQIPDNTPSGGNKRGQRSVDWQLLRSNPNQVASGPNSVISGGANNTASANYAVVVGGNFNVASGAQSFIGGGDINTASAAYTTITGGNFNSATTTGATVGGGMSNHATDFSTFVGGGNQNNATSSFATISGGGENRASGAYSAVVGGYQNLASGSYAFVGTGQQDTASSFAAVVSGGVLNKATAAYTAIPGGRGLTLDGQSSFGYLANFNGTNDMTVSTHNTAVFGNTNLWLATNDDTTRSLRFYERYNTAGNFPNGSNFVGFKAPDNVQSDVTYTLPDADGSDGDQLTTNGSGTLSWAPASIPCGGIVMWQGDFNNVPAGWALCDGNNGTPDLNDRFPRGTTNSQSFGNTGGNDAHSHTVDDHSHTISSLSASGSVDNGAVTGTAGNATTGISATASLDAGSALTTDGSNNFASTSTVVITDNGHGHSISGSLTSTGVTISSVSGSTDNSSGVGTSQSSNVPSYVYVGFIMRVCAQ